MEVNEVFLKNMEVNEVFLKNMEVNEVFLIHSDNFSIVSHEREMRKSLLQRNQK